jgi:hypothetical protein
LRCYGKPLIGLHSFWTALVPLSKSGAARRGQQKWRPVLRPAALNKEARPSKVEAGFASGRADDEEMTGDFGKIPTVLRLDQNERR